MPFCSQCGALAQPNHKFCAACGAPQPQEPGSGGTGAQGKPILDIGIPAKTLSILCYVPVMGWVASVIALAAEQYRRQYVLRFHAFQGLYLFVTWLIVHDVLRPIFRELPGPLHNLIRVASFVVIATGVFMMVKVNEGKSYSLPFLGELAERSAAE